MRGVCFFMDYELMMNGNVKIGQKAPDFQGKWLVLFSHHGDFTPVKP